MPPKDNPGSKKKDVRTSPSEGQQAFEQGASSSNKGGKISDFATLQYQHDQSSKHADTPPSGSETTSVDPALKSEIETAFREANQMIEGAHETYKAEYADHFENSKQQISETAQFALDRVPPGQPKKACILGLGHSFEIDLREIVTKFDHVTVIEFDERTARDAINRLIPKKVKKQS